MCKKLRYCAIRIDPCIIDGVRDINGNLPIGSETILSCCGHGKVHPTIIIRNEDNTVWEWFSGIKLKDYQPKKPNRYYKRIGKCKGSLMIIPEVVQNTKNNQTNILSS